MMQRDLVTAALVAVWYLASLAFNLGMKRSHALVPDVMLHTSMQLAAGAAVAGMSVLAGGIGPWRAWWAWRWPLLSSSALLLGGTLCTNVSLVMLSVSFTHVIKTCEPLFTVVIIFAWDCVLPHRTAALSVVTTTAGAVVASALQRKAAKKSSDFAAGVVVALLSNFFLQLRNVLNKRLLLAPPPPLPRLPAAELLLLSLTAALPMQLAVQEGSRACGLVPSDGEVASRYAHYRDAHPAWLAVPPLSFVAYQLASILVLARVDPLTHATLNSLKRVLVIGLSALWMLEPISADFVAGSAVAVVGAACYSLAKLLSASSRAHTRTQLALLGCLAALIAFSLRPLAAPLAPKPSPPAVKLHEHEHERRRQHAPHGNASSSQPHHRPSLALHNSSSRHHEQHNHSHHEQYPQQKVDRPHNSSRGRTAAVPARAAQAAAPQ